MSVTTLQVNFDKNHEPPLALPFPRAPSPPPPPPPLPGWDAIPSEGYSQH